MQELMDLVQVVDGVVFFHGIPQFLWEGMLNFGAGLIVAGATTFYFKKKDESTRVAGVILEKRVNAQQNIVDFLESENYKYELPGARSQRIYHRLTQLGFALPYGRSLQYSIVFGSLDRFNRYFEELQRLISQNRLWIDKKVRRHLMLLQGYYAQVNALQLVVPRIPLPEGAQPLSQEEQRTATEEVLLQMGVLLDGEINALQRELDTLVVDSIYKLDLRRPKKSLMRNNMANIEMASIALELEEDTILGREKERIFDLVRHTVYELRGLSPLAAAQPEEEAPAGER